jgi:hypothetical protein
MIKNKGYWLLAMKAVHFGIAEDGPFLLQRRGIRHDSAKLPAFEK